MQLTNAERRSLLELFRRLAIGWERDDSALIAETTMWAAGLRREFGFEDNLARDIIFLSDTLRKSNRTNDVAELARGALAFLQQSNLNESPSFGSFGLLDDAFVAGYAAHLIREKLGEPARYSPPKLCPEEKARAEELFLELLDRSADEDDGLPVRALAALGRLGHLLESGMFRRLWVNVQFLIRVLCDSERPADHRQVARAALHYVTLDNDVIADQLGLLGFLDDYFVADLAVDLIDDGRPPWLNLADATVAAWPFLNMVVFQEGGSGIPLSEFLLVNTALVCPDVRGTNHQPLTHLILPRTGPLPLLLGFLASLGVLWKARADRGDQIPFHSGQKVLVDGKAVRTFIGCQLDNGRVLFGLQKVRKEHGQELRSIEWLPIDQLSRVVPADRDRVTRGRISQGIHQNEPVQALDYLFLSAEPVVIPRDVPQIVVSSPVKRCRETAEVISLFGQRLIDAVPMGHLTSGGEVCPWSSRFGNIRPAILVIPDLDRACEYVEEEGEQVSLTVVDATGHNAGRTASLTRLGSLGARVLVVTSQADADESLTEDVDTIVWEWEKGDFDSLLSEPVPSNNSEQVGLVRRFERDVVQSLSATVDIVQVCAGGFTEAYEGVRGLEELVQFRSEEVPFELDKALDLSFNILTRLLRCPFPLADHPRLSADLAAQLASIATVRAMKTFLTVQEMQAVEQVEERLRALYDLLLRDSPKAEALSRINSPAGSVTVFCGDAGLLEDIDGLTVRPVTDAVDGFFSRSTDATFVISGWYGRRTMTRLLSPPFASPLRLILYEIEAEWYRAFQHQSKRKSTARRGRSSRSHVFPCVSGWPKPRQGREDRVSDSESSIVIRTLEDPIESWRSRMFSRRRRQLTASAAPSSSDATVTARLVLFDGGYAFLTDKYRAKVATHLFEPTDHAEDTELRLVSARQLKRGDVVLFLRGSDRDVIREEADKLLQPGERERAGIWREALLDYRTRTGCSIETIWHDLKSFGCPIGLQAIRNWFEGDLIAPLKYERELEAIRKLTEFPKLVQQYDDCLIAIFNVRSAHLRASRQLARRVLDLAVTTLKTSQGGPVDLGDGIILVRITEIDNVNVQIKATAANKLIES